jgi:lipid A 4'-phosphatase
MFQFKNRCGKNKSAFCDGHLTLRFRQLKGFTVTCMSLPEKTSITGVPKFNGRWRILSTQFAVLLLLTVFFTFFDWDRSVAQRFYQDAQGWYLEKQPLWVWLHDYGTIPGIVLTLAALITWGAGFYFHTLTQWRKPCLVVVLTTIVAAGLLVNAVLKQYWGRPRPSQTIEFGGKWEYRPIFPPGTPGKGASFPCGHCTMGFVFLSMVAFRRRSKVLAYGGVAVGIVLGGLLSAARVVQGAHFLSDIIWSLGIIWMVATALEIYLPEAVTADSTSWSLPASNRRRTLIALAAIAVAIAISGGFMTRRPYYNTMTYPLDISSTIKAVHININADPESLAVTYADQKNGQLKVDAHGFGWMKFEYRMGFGSKVIDQVLKITIRIEANSYFAELDHALTLILPLQSKDKVTVKLNQAIESNLPPSVTNGWTPQSSHAETAAQTGRCDIHL